MDDSEDAMMYSDEILDNESNDTEVVWWGDKCITTPPGSYLHHYVFLLPVFAFIIIACNGTLLTVLLNAKIAKKRVNWHITSLACADLLLGLSLIVRFFLLASREKAIYIYLCYGSFSLHAFVCTCSIANLLMLVIDRYIFVVHAMQYHQIVTKRVSATMIVLAWVLSFLAGFLPLLGFKTDVPSEVCVVSRGFLILISMWYCFPIAGIIVLYLRISCLICSKHKLRDVPQLMTAVEEGGDTYQQQCTSFQQVLHNLKLVRPVVIIVVCFAVSWMPNMIINLASVHPAVSCVRARQISKSFALLRYSNSIMNPVLYSWYNQQIRSTIYDYFPTRFKSNSTPSPSK